MRSFHEQVWLQHNWWHTCRQVEIMKVWAQADTALQHLNASPPVCPHHSPLQACSSSVATGAFPMMLAAMSKGRPQTNSPLIFPTADLAHHATANLAHALTPPTCPAPALMAAPAALLSPPWDAASSLSCLTTSFAFRIHRPTHPFADQGGGAVRASPSPHPLTHTRTP